MRILILTADYQSFLKWFYIRNPGLDQASYSVQHRARVDSLFGVADFYSRNFAAFGHQAADIFTNNLWMQSAWGREHGMTVPQTKSPGEMALADSNEFVMTLKRKLRPYKTILSPLAKRLGLIPSVNPIERRILLAQIADMDPDIILNQVPEIVGSDIMHAVKRPGRVLIVQHGNQPPDNLDVTPYTFGISLIPWVVAFFRERGLPAEQCHLAFDASVLEQLGPPPAKDIEVSFVGGLSAGHGKRIELLEAIAREFPIQLWLSSFKGIPKSSPLHARMRGEVWAHDMYNVLRRSKITLNSHIDAARGMAGNVRLYEATGVGTFLLTDNLPNLPTLFEPGVHVAAFDSVGDCIAKIKYYLAHEAEREAIARAGQEHTLKQHNYQRRVEAILALANKYAR